jgi:hypothetical protein
MPENVFLNGRCSQSWWMLSFPEGAKGAKKERRRTK